MGMQQGEIVMVKFQVGKSYSCRSICDWDCVFTYHVTHRTAQTITIRSEGKCARRKIRMRDGVEEIDPKGRYSMSPVLRADRMVPTLIIRPLASSLVV
jgi:hypothetical protein